MGNTELSKNESFADSRYPELHVSYCNGVKKSNCVTLVQRSEEFRLTAFEISSLLLLGFTVVSSTVVSTCESKPQNKKCVTSFDLKAT